MKRKKYRNLLALAVIILLLRVAMLFPGFIEHYYARGLYPVISSFLRILLGWLPFSIGDCIYGILILGVAVLLYRILSSLVRGKWKKQIVFNGLYRLLTALLGIYIVFLLFWGLNYYRRGIRYQLNLPGDVYSTAGLDSLTQELGAKAGRYRRMLGSTIRIPSSSYLFRNARIAYDSAAVQLPFLQYRFQSVKPSLYSEPGNYLGFTGYYNPFTGEAQVNVRTPHFFRPYVTCHEMAHQLGYATEDEANFVGYLAARSSRSAVFRYSVYADLFEYANNELFYRDSLLARKNFKALDTLVRKDFYDARNFYLRYHSPVEKIINLLYGQYLKANNQPQGMDTYSEVVSLLMAYRKKYGQI